MLFNSFEFLVFFPTVFLLYFLLPYRFRWVLLLIASYIFYMFWRIDYTIIIIISTLIDYGCGRMMDRYPDEERGKRKYWLWLSLLSNLGILFTFKYYNFFSSAAEDLANLLGVSYAAPAFQLLLPMGISFYTFQTMSYSIDVYYGRTKAERHLGIFALFVTFFPQLVAGPIERAENLLNQLKQKHDFEYQRVTNGLRLMAWGLFKKMVIADRLAPMVNEVYSTPEEYAGIPLILATVFFAFQIYCDFSGYSDIAIGSANVMGFKLMENFRTPYHARSIKEFWGRWHISLSTWFRDYLYIPLGGNRVLKWRWYYNIFITFVVSGLWHGANWTFIVWGALHGVYLVFAEVSREQRNSLVETLGLKRLPWLHKALQVGTTFSLVCLAWVFFRANTINDAWYISTHMLSGLSESVNVITYNIDGLRTEWLYLGQSLPKLLAAFFVIGILELVQLQQKSKGLQLMFSHNPLIRWSGYYILVALIIFMGVFGQNEFIYFQF
ncbi:MBOAT family O-acyltransferase [Pontibacter pamirensis]|uniref:MBOAT family O-acyltransferase n=1 Tax=Pontibacter pamirensis TaxID=2562824 RepID=UPI001389562A|nr:MBOAT family O-acyltransferase [Pontibacter pamirensis]